jgi:hypothetical protein
MRALIACSCSITSGSAILVNRCTSLPFHLAEAQRYASDVTGCGSGADRASSAGGQTLVPYHRLAPLSSQFLAPHGGHTMAHCRRYGIHAFLSWHRAMDDSRHRNFPPFRSTSDWPLKGRGHREPRPAWVIQC